MAESSPYMLFDEEQEDAVVDYVPGEMGELESEREEDDDDDNEAEDYIQIVESPRVPDDSGQATIVVFADEERIEKRRRVENRGGGELCLGNADDRREGCSQGSQSDRAETDCLSCPICMESCTGDGDHHVCCLPCGHLFGFSCIRKWLQKKRSPGKCPQCNRKCTLKGVRKLYAPMISVLDDEPQKKIQFLEVKCASLEKKVVDWLKKESDWQKREVELQSEVNQLKERTAYLENLLGGLQSRPSELGTAGGDYRDQILSGKMVNSKDYWQGSSGSFVLQRELGVEGARLFDIDVSGQIVLLARRLPRMGGSHVLTKMSLISPHDSEDIFLPSSIKMVKDLHISPLNGNHALLASLGKKLSVLSTQSNNVILSYDLPAAAWSCSWDLNSSQYIYAGLQNGLLLVFDMRQTRRPLESRLGLTNNPIHTIYSLRHCSSLPSGGRMVLSASSIGICQWNFGYNEERPSLVPETANQDVCISLAYCPRSDDIVAMYRPKVEMSGEVAFSQPLLTPSATIGQGIWGSHLHFKRVGNNYEKFGSACATVSDIRLPKSTIIDGEDQKPVFAAGDEITHQLVLQLLPSFIVADRLKTHKHFICDVKYARAFNQGLLGCLSEDTFQLFSRRLS